MDGTTSAIVKESKSKLNRDSINTSPSALDLSNLAHLNNHSAECLFLQTIIQHRLTILRLFNNASYSNIRIRF